MKDFKDKVLVVTGGSSGIGQAIAKEGALRGMKIIINGMTEAHVEETLDMLRKLRKKRGRPCRCLDCRRRYSEREP